MKKIIMVLMMILCSYGAGAIAEEWRTPEALRAFGKPGDTVREPSTDDTTTTRKKLHKNQKRAVNVNTESSGGGFVALGQHDKVSAANAPKTASNSRCSGYAKDVKDMEAHLEETKIKLKTASSPGYERIYREEIVHSKAILAAMKDLLSICK